MCTRGDLYENIHSNIMHANKNQKQLKWPSTVGQDKIGTFI